MHATYLYTTPGTSGRSDLVWALGALAAEVVPDGFYTHASGDMSGIETLRVLMDFWRERRDSKDPATEYSFYRTLDGAPGEFSIRVEGT